MAQGNQYPAPQLPLIGTEQWFGYQYVNGQVVNVTFTLSQITAIISAGAFASPPAIGNITPNSGNFTTLTASTYFIDTSLSVGITATGNNQATAYQLNKQINFITDVPANSGVVLQIVPLGTKVVVANKDYADNQYLNVYPQTGGQIENLGLNTAIQVAPGSSINLFYAGSGQWYVI